MSIPTPTSSNVSGLSAALPPGAPDESLLARMASELFAALPGQSAPAFGSGSGAQAFAPAPTPQAPAVPLPQSAPSSPVTATVPAAPQHGLSLGASSPKLVPHATAQNHVPDVASDAYPVGSPRSAAAQGVPEAYAASLPAVGGAPAFPAGGASAPSSPYYFIGESSALQSAPQAAPGVPHDDRLTAQSFGLPGSDALRALLAEPSHGASPTAAPSPSASPSYYFVEPNAAPTVGHAGRVPNADAGRHPPFDVNAVRRDFPILAERVNGRQLVWFDNAATTQKPQAVIDRLSYFYAHENSNIHRAAHELAARATDAYEAARQKVARFIGAGSVEEVIFVRGATEAINLVAKSWGAKNIREGDEIIVSHLEHHANIVPWQQLAAETGAKIRVIPVDDSGQVLLGEYERLLNEKTKLVAVTQVSNALGTVVPVREIVELAHRAGAKTLIDGAQSVSHMRVDVRALDTDFFVFSGHKIFGPTGIGVVYGKRDILEDMPPWQGGGNMIKDVTFERTIFHPPPGRFRSRYRQHCRCRRSRCRTRLCRPRRHREHRALRARPAGVCDARNRRHSGCATDRNCGRQGERAVLRAEGLHDRRSGSGAERGRHRGAYRTPLRTAHSASLWSGNHGAPVAGLLQHLRRGGSFRRGGQASGGAAQELSASQLPVDVSGFAKHTGLLSSNGNRPVMHCIP